MRRLGRARYPIGMAVNLYAVLAPAVFVLVAAEIAYCLIRRNGFYKFQDSVANMGTALIAQSLNVPVGILAYAVYHQLHGRFSPWSVEPSAGSYLILYLMIDFLFYWFHRLGHTIPFLWAVHAPHHSSEELNYTVGLRSSYTQRFMSFAFYWPPALLGFPPEMILPTVAAHLTLQLVPHTRVIPKLGFLEHFMNTPSHHRVHHGVNGRYRDSNFGGTIILWDKLFGSFQEEREEVLYGVTRPVESWNPDVINAAPWKPLFAAAAAHPRWIDKLKVFLVPGFARGRAPSDAAIAARARFETTPLPGAKAYLMGQVPAALFLLLFVVRDASPLSTGLKLALAGTLWIAAIAWSDILSGERRGVLLEAVRIAVTALLCATEPGLVPGTAAAVLLFPFILKKPQVLAPQKA